MANGYPVVNLNGASFDSLLEARQTAYHAIRAAMAALSECRPNGRDYQTAPPGEYAIALARYVDQFAALDKTCNEINDECCALQDQHDARLVMRTVRP